MSNLEISNVGSIVKKDNDLIRTKISIQSVEASRILGHLISCIKVDDTELKHTYRVAVKDFLPHGGGNDYQQLVKACKELLFSVAEIERFAEQNNEFSMTSFFINITYKKGYIYAVFNPMLKELLLNLKQCFTQYFLVEYKNLPCVASQRLFEILKSWENVAQGYVDIDIKDLHFQLNSPSYQVEDFNNFRRCVLDKAHKDIHEHTSLNYDWEAFKVGRTYTTIRFYFRKNIKAPALSSSLTKLQKEENRKELHYKRMKKAHACARSKKGECLTRDNLTIVCKVCTSTRLLEMAKEEFSHTYSLINSTK